MTDSTPAPTPTVPTAALGPDDPRAVFAAAVGTAGTVIGSVRPDQLTLSTPCDAMTVDDLLAHLVLVLDRVARLGRDEDPFADDMEERAARATAQGRWADAWTVNAHAVQAAWTDDAVLDRMMTLPWMTAPGRAVLDMYTNELTVHTWDLATALGQEPEWDEQVVEVSYRAITMGLPPEGRTEMFEQIWADMPEDERTGVAPFAEAVAVSDDAPAIDRLVAYTGRTPLRSGLS